MHLIHARSRRVDADVGRCDTCRLSAASIRRDSKSAVDAYGPVTSIYVGGPAESFSQRTSSCHTSTRQRSVNGTSAETSPALE